MPDSIPTRGTASSDPNDDIIPLSVDDISTLRDETDPDRTGPHRPAESLDLPVLPGYVIEGELGRGGMGVVFKARHLKLNRPTALKMVLGSARADSKEIIRFLAEAEAVAAVRHPHVVGVYEFGEADGRPYLALEYCPGGSLAEQLASGGRKPPVEAADLVRKLAEGVAAAHDLGIVHRDLKPGNVLFDEAGEPRVSDFGLAKRGAGADLTQTNVVMGSPAYMSPEQAKGETKFVGPQADVWALGVILYECLAGSRPFRADDSWSLLQKVIAEEPAGVRTVTRAVPRDLDLICRKCLAKAPHERYATAAELAEDLGRFLDGRPILARPPGPLGRGWKWVKRNKPAVLVIAALAGMAGMAVWQAVRANDEAVRASDEAANARAAEGIARDEEQKAKAAANEERKARTTVEEVADFMQTVFIGENPQEESVRARDAKKPRTVMEAMDEAARTIEGKFGDRPEIEAAVRDAIGVTYQGLGAYAEARPQLEKALALRETALGPDHRDTLTSVHNLASLLQDNGDYASAEMLFRRAVAGEEKTLGPDHPTTLTSVYNLAILYYDKGDYAASESFHSKALAGREKVFGPDHLDTLKSVNSLAILHTTQGDYASAEPLFQRVLVGYEKALGPDHPQTLTSVNNLASLLQFKRDHQAAEPLCRRVLAGWEKALGPDHPETLTSVHNLAFLLRAKGDYAAAEPLDRRALAGREKVLGPDHPDTLLSVHNLASLLHDKGDLAAAEPFYRRALAGREKVLGPDHRDTLTSANDLVLLLTTKGDYASAEPLVQRALAGREKAFGPDHPQTLASVSSLAMLYVAMKHYADAVPLLERATTGYARRQELARFLPSVRADLGLALLATGQPGEAEPHLLAGHDGLSKLETLRPANRNRLRSVTAGLAELYESTNQPAKAAEWRAKLAALPPEVAPRPRPAK